jgi:hypothetical protein
MERAVVLIGVSLGTITWLLFRNMAASFFILAPALLLLCGIVVLVLVKAPPGRSLFPQSWSVKQAWSSVARSSASPWTRAYVVVAISALLVALLVAGAGVAIAVLHVYGPK